MNNDFKEKLADASVAELEQLCTKIEKLMIERKVKALDDARIQVRELAASLGVTLEELIAEPEKPKKQTKKAAIKFRNTENPDETWTGRGKQPRWLTQAIDNGAMIEKFAV